MLFPLQPVQENRFGLSRHSAKKKNPAAQPDHQFAGMLLRRKILLGAVGFVCASHSLWAHAILIDAVPSANLVTSGHEIAIKLRFNSRIDGKRSRLSLLGPDERERDLVIGEQPSPDTITSAAKALPPGAYVLRWQVLAVDGHITRGEVPFRTQ